MSPLPKATDRFLTSSIKIPEEDFTGLQRAIPSSLWSQTKPRRAKTSRNHKTTADIGMETDTRIDGIEPKTWVSFQPQMDFRCWTEDAEMHNWKQTHKRQHFEQAELAGLSTGLCL